MATNCYIVENVIIDPGDDAEYISDTLTKYAIRPKAILATHGHFDHIMAARALQLAYEIPVYIHTLDFFLVKRMRESAKHFLGTHSDPPPDVTPLTNDTVLGFTILHTPGHTPGSICLVNAGVLYTGDTIFAGGAVGRTDHHYSSREKLKESIGTIMKYPPKTRLFPGHGEPTTVGSERVFHVQ